MSQPELVKRSRQRLELQRDGWGCHFSGVAFGGFGVGWVKGLPLAAAQVGEVNGNWSLTCGYGQPGFMETLGTGNSLLYGQCKFANGTQTCKGTIDQCALNCPSKPVVPKVLAVKGAK